MSTAPEPQGLSILIPAHDEAGYIGACLDALLASDTAGRVQVVVIANGCSDDTADRARARVNAAQARGWEMVVIEEPRGGKLNALNRGEAVAVHGNLAYLDADVIVSPPLVATLGQALARGTPCYASGRPVLAPAHSRLARAYGRFWMRLPFAKQPAPGFGLFAVNAAGRTRWGAWPDIISDDTFVRLQFSAAERVEVTAGYDWPLIEGFANLVRVRRRQDAGVEEIARLYPGLLANDATPRLSPWALAGLILRDPVGFAAYAAVTLAVKTPFARSGTRWARGR